MTDEPPWLTRPKEGDLTDDDLAEMLREIAEPSDAEPLDDYICGVMLANNRKGVGVDRVGPETTDNSVPGPDKHYVRGLSP